MDDQDHPAATVQGTCQLLFAEVDGDVVLCDLVALDGFTGSAAMVMPGSPFTLGLRPPYSVWFARTMTEVLQRWADQCRMVELTVNDIGGQPRAMLSCDDVKIRLEVDLTHNSR
jgi:hypothetical protein